MKLNGAGQTATGVRSVTAEAAAYGVAKAQLEQQVGEGETLLSIRRLRRLTRRKPDTQSPGQKKTQPLASRRENWVV